MTRSTGTLVPLSVALTVLVTPAAAFANSMPGPDYTFGRDEWLSALVCAVVIAAVAGAALVGLARISRSARLAEQTAQAPEAPTESRSA